MSDADKIANSRAAGAESAPAAALPSANAGGDPLVLSIADLLPDAQGEVVLFNDAGLSAFSIVGAQSVIGSGIADHHATAEGIDVTGMAYSTFETGLTVYYPSDVTLLLT
jgi:hypothetical protein